MNGHTIDAGRCTHCQRSIAETSRLKSWCPGLPWFVAGCAPDNLKTQSQLKKRGLKPSGPPVGCVVTSFHQFVMLYDINETRAIKPESEPRKAARLQTWLKTQEKWKCQECQRKPANIGDLHHYWFMPGQCSACREQAIYQAEQEDFFIMLKEDRQGAVNWARNLLARQDWCILDTETTSLDGVVIELAIIAPDGQLLLESRVNPGGVAISREAESIHGISSEMLESAPILPEIWPAVLTALAEKNTIVTYNAAFDRARLDQSTSRYNLTIPDVSWQCAMEAYAEYCGNWSAYHKSYTWQPLDGGHSALLDCLACLKRLREMARQETKGREE